MIPDPAQQLVDIGRRVLRIAQPLVTLPGPGRFPDAYENLLLDPLGVLSDTCNELLERSGTVPAAAEPDGSPSEPGSGFVFDPDVHATSPPSRAVAATPTTRTPRDGHKPHAGSWRESPRAVRLDTSVSGTGEPLSLEQVRRAMEAPLVSFLDEPGRDLGLPEVPAATHPGGSASRSGDTTRLSGRSQQPTRREPDPHGAPYAVEQPPLVDGRLLGPDRLYDESSSGGRGGTWRPASRGWPEDGRTESSPGAMVRAGDDIARGAREADVPGLAGQPPVGGYPPSLDDSSAETLPRGHGPAQALPRREPTENEWPTSRHTDTRDAAGLPRGTLEVRTTTADPHDGVRLVANPSRLATMLREHVLAVETENLFEMARDDAAAFPAQPEDDGRSTDSADESDRVRLDGRIGVEEIMERLADELETEFVRTYGSSGS